MSDKISDEIYQTRPKEPNFLLVVILGSVSILVIFAIAFLVLSDTGKRIFPKLHPDAHPNSYVLPAHSTTVNA